jgi:hypothetical protein
VTRGRQTIRRHFAGRERDFLLRSGEIDRLEMLCEAGIGAILGRAGTYSFYRRDIRETIRLGLEGGGLSKIQAEALVRAEVDEAPIEDALNLASAILTATLRAVPQSFADGEDAAGAPDLEWFNKVIAAGGAMGWTPDQVAASTVAEMVAAMGGFAAAQGAAPTDKAPSEDEFTEVLAEEMAAGRA